MFFFLVFFVLCFFLPSTVKSVLSYCEIYVVLSFVRNRIWKQVTETKVTTTTIVTDTKGFCTYVSIPAYVSCAGKPHFLDIKRHARH